MFVGINIFLIKNVHFYNEENNRKKRTHSPTNRSYRCEPNRQNKRWQNRPQRFHHCG